MARIEQRICDRCNRVDPDGTDHGWALLEVKNNDIDMCRACSTDLITWIAQGVTSWPEDIVTDAMNRQLDPIEGGPREPVGARPRPPVVAVTRVEPPRG